MVRRDSFLISLQLSISRAHEGHVSDDMQEDFRVAALTFSHKASGQELLTVSIFNYCITRLPQT